MPGSAAEIFLVRSIANGIYEGNIMTHRLLAGLVAAGIGLASASAFAATPAPATGPAPAAHQKVASASKTACQKEWKTGEKAGKLGGLDQKDFLAKCQKGA